MNLFVDYHTFFPCIIFQFLLSPFWGRAGEAWVGKLVYEQDFDYCCSGTHRTLQQASDSSVHNLLNQGIKTF